MGRFRDALSGSGLAAIAEIKRRSPSAGDLRPGAEPAELAAAFERSGAAAVSVLVDERFAGSLEDLRAARAAASLPLLGKGFFSREEELDKLKGAGADAALLLLRDLDDSRAAPLMEHAQRIGLDTLVEAHDEMELERAVALGGDPIGINARDLATFRINRQAQLALVSRAPRDRILVAESGIETRAQGAAAELAGAAAILVGSTLMRAPDPAAKLAELISRPLVKVCGLTREEDVAVAVEAGADFCGFILVEASPRRAERVLPVPSGTLTVAVFVGEVGEAEADLVQLYSAEHGTRARPRRCPPPRRRGRRAGSRFTVAGARPHPPRACSRRERPRDARGQPGAGERARRDRGGPAVGCRRRLVSGT
jgi:indole-3-glycerol phosphate synthase/phosphoribosylanthranilate isomerase